MLLRSPNGRHRQVGLLAWSQGVVWHHRDGSSPLAGHAWQLRAAEQVHIKLQLLVGQVLHPEGGVDCEHLHSHLVW